MPTFLIATQHLQAVMLSVPQCRLTPGLSPPESLLLLFWCQSCWHIAARAPQVAAESTCPIEKLLLVLSLLSFCFYAPWQLPWAPNNRRQLFPVLWGTGLASPKLTYILEALYCYNAAFEACSTCTAYGRA